MGRGNPMVRVRHKCNPECIVEVNKNLTDSQKARIHGTPFKWLMKMPERTQISENLLFELVSRWEKRKLGFRVQNRVVPFTPLDVCFAIGLRIVGEKVSFHQADDCRLKRMFEGKKITIPTIVEQLKKFNGDEHVADFCRMYILLGFAEFYIPKTGYIVDGGLLRTLDELHSLDKYSWGVVIYDFLVRSLTRASNSLCEGKISQNVHITGCAAVLQIWALEHVYFHHARATTFPRFIHWHHVAIGKKKMSSMFENNFIYEELAASNEELGHEVLKEAMQKAPGGFRHWHQPIFHSTNLVHEIHVLGDKNKELKHRISILEEELRVISQKIKSSPQSKLPTTSSTSEDNKNMVFENLNGGSPPVFPESISECLEIPEVVDPPQQNLSDMYARLKEQPRERKLSSISRTPWITYHRKSKKTQDR